MGRNTDIFDRDLNPVLENASDEELGILHDILMQKWNEELSTHEAYKRHYPNHGRYADLIAKESRDYGGNSFRNLLRGEGPSYREIACDVASKLKAPFNKSHDIARIEHSILETVLVEALDNMAEKEREELLKALKDSNGSWAAASGASTMAFQGIFQAGGFASYQLTLIIVNTVVKNLVGRGLSLAANAMMMRVASLATGPIGIAFTTALTAVQLAGPAFKVTIPTVVYVAMLRKQQTADQRHRECSSCGAMIYEGFAFCPECGHPTAPEVEQKTIPAGRAENDRSQSAGSGAGE